MVQYGWYSQRRLWLTVVVVVVVVVRGGIVSMGDWVGGWMDE